ncbi:50S ribosomal protein L21 [Staphylococcus aureus]
MTYYTGGAKYVTYYWNRVKQIKVKEGQEILVEKLDVNEGDTFTFDKVLFVGGYRSETGAPTVESAQQLLLLLINKVAVKKLLYSHTNVVKIQKRRKGHRQPYTKLTINKINA